MPELERQEEQAPPRVENRATKPLGILPKNTQAMVIAAISVIMVGAIAFSGSTAPKATSKPVPSGTPAVVDPNQARIAEYRQRLDEQARKLAAEQAEFQQTRQQFGAATGAPNAGMSVQPSPQPTGYAIADPARNEEDSIENDRKKRAYLSLFASNVALTYRNSSSPSSSAIPNDAPTPGKMRGTAPIITPSGYFVPFSSSAETPASGASTAEGAKPIGAHPTASQQSSSESHDGTEDKTITKDGHVDQELNKSEGKQYHLFEGSVIESVLTNRLNGSFAGPINCMVTTNVYSHDGQQLLIPQGSRVLGEVKRVAAFGQERLSVVFHRLIMPDGYSISLDQFKGLNQIGETGLRDQINHHYMQIFGVSLAIGAVAGLAQADTRSAVFQSSTDAYRQGIADSLSQSSLRILDRFLNVLPTLTIREGHRVKIYLSDDLLLPAYQNHRIPGDL